MRSRLRSSAVAVGLALAILLACRQLSPGHGHAAHGGYRAQVDALLAGHLALTRAPEGLRHDLAWTPEGVQQVWGLGAPLWQLPFEAFGRLVGITPFPDRVALAAWLAIMLFALLRAFRPRAVPADPALQARRTERIEQIGALLLTALLPAFVSLLRGRLGIYEEAAVYAYGAAMILLAGTVAFTRRPTARRYLVLLAFAGLTGLFRPTVWFYGLATALIASAQLLHARRRRAVAPVALGLALFVAGGGALYATNALRFGRGSEFGHRLNVHSLPGNLVATRFSYPFERAGTVEAAEELVTSLFDRPELRSKRGFYQTGLHHGQSPLPRWREYYFTTYSWPYLPVLLAGLVLGALAWRRRGDPLTRTLVAWAVLGGAPLAAFYLHSPSVSSRYQLDLAPAFVAVLLITWRAATARAPRSALAAVIALWALAIVTSKITRPKTIPDPVGPGPASAARDEISRAPAYPHPLPGAYDLADPFLPSWTDVVEAFVRCGDASGAVIDCAAPPLAGDVIVTGHRDDRAWYVVRDVVTDPAPPDRSPLAEPATTCVRDPDIQTAPAIRDLSYVLPSALYLNGSAWDLATGAVPPATLFYVDDADFITLDLRGPPDTDWAHAARVAIGLDHLALIAIAETADGAQLRFAGAPHPGLQIAFLAFGPDTDLARPRARVALQAIRWR